MFMSKVQSSMSNAKLSAYLFCCEWCTFDVVNDARLILWWYTCLNLRVNCQSMVNLFEIKMEWSIWMFSVHNISQFYTYVGLHNFIMDQKWPWVVIHSHGHGWSVHENDDLTLYMKIDLLEFYTIT
jgi:hypothetical protein